MSFVYSVNVTVEPEPEVKLDYVLIYINMMMCFISIIFVSCSATLRGLSGKAQTPEISNPDPLPCPLPSM